MTFPLDPEAIRHYRAYMQKRISDQLMNEEQNHTKVYINGVWVNFSDLTPADQARFLQNLNAAAEALRNGHEITPRVPTPVPPPIPASGVASTMATKTAAAPPAPAPEPLQLTAWVACDKRDCGHRSYVRVTMESGTMYFCGHHGHELEPTLRPKSLAWLDETHVLSAKLDVSA